MIQAFSLIFIFFSKASPCGDMNNSSIRSNLNFGARTFCFWRYVGSKLAFCTKNLQKIRILQTQFVNFAYFETRNFRK
jgi:hypothetical protein